MTQADAQLMALKTTRNRVIEIKDLMVPLVEQMAAEGSSLARHLVAELQKAEEAMALANMDAHNFIEENTHG